MPYKDPDKQKQAQRQHYQDNKAVYAKRSETARQKRQAIVRSLMTPCLMCGDYDAAIMDWHHLDPSTKVGGINELAKSKPLQVALDEIEKCICLCSNCHRKLHFYNLSPPE